MSWQKVRVLTSLGKNATKKLPVGRSLTGSVLLGSDLSCVSQFAGLLCSMMKSASFFESVTWTPK